MIWWALVESGLLRDLVKHGLDAARRRQRVAWVTPFFVKKKGSKQRVVWDCRSTNRLCRQPPATELGGGEGLQEVALSRNSILRVVQEVWKTVLPLRIARLALRLLCRGDAALFTGVSLPGAL